MVLGNAATSSPNYILIDEPELNLHPSLQLDFLTSLAAYAKTGVLFSTHSIGLARAAGDRIYSLRLEEEGKSSLTPYEATPRLSEFLGELNYSAYQVLGFEQVLLVEGRTDVKTFQQFLRMYGKDHKIVILPLGGAQMITEVAEDELTELKRITTSISVVIDSERKNEGDDPDYGRVRFQEMCERAGIACRISDRRAIENYFTDEAVQTVKGDKYRALGKFEKLSDLPLSWAKTENWRIAGQMTKGDIEATDLGDFLEAL